MRENWYVMTHETDNGEATYIIEREIINREIVMYTSRQPCNDCMGNPVEGGI